MTRVGFLINPIAGMGGRVGLKGTDDVVAEAIELGAHPMAHEKAAQALGELQRLLCAAKPQPPAVAWITCSGPMGADALRAAGFGGFDLAYAASEPTTRDDTKAAVRQFLAMSVDLILFCGGDGTARDICSVATDMPILGIPSGVKMYSGVFGINPARTAEILLGFLDGRLALTNVDVLDLDEERYRKGEWVVRLYHSARTPYEPTLTQSAKMLIEASTDAEVKDDIATYLLEQIEAAPDILFLLGPGSTVQAVGKALDIDKTLLGIDAVAGKRVVGKDLNELQILELLRRYPERQLVLSPIGAQGFVLGRGNLQLTAEIVRAIGRENFMVVATPAKLARTPLLRFDTGDVGLDDELTAGGYLPVIVGYRRRRLVKVAI